MVQKILEKDRKNNIEIKKFYKADLLCFRCGNIVQRKKFRLSESYFRFINWFFRNEERGIILEGDLLPARQYRYTFSQ